jgi:hypothetical protein
VVEGGRFEIYCRATYRGFESRSLRHLRPVIVLLRRGVRVAEGARLESECRATYRGFESRLLRHFLRHWRRPQVVVGSPWSGIRELRQDRKVATVSVPPRCGGTRPSPGVFKFVKGTT